MQIDEKEKKGLGCWFYGCLTMLILMLLLASAAVFAAYKFTTYAIAKFTDAAPLAYAAQNFSPETAAATRRKIEAFSLLLEQQPEPATLALTQDELNAFLLSSQGMTQNDVQAEVELHDNRIAGKISLPLDNILPFSLGKGRYVNGAAGLNAFTRDGKLFVFLKSLEVKGQQVPAYIMKELGSVNLAEQQAKQSTENETQTPEFEVMQLRIQEGQISISMKKSRH